MATFGQRLMKGTANGSYLKPPNTATSHCEYHGWEKHIADQCTHDRQFASRSVSAFSRNGVHGGLERTPGLFSTLRAIAWIPSIA